MTRLLVLELEARRHLIEGYAQFPDVPEDVTNLWKAPFGPPEEWDLCVAEQTIDGPHGPVPVRVYMPTGPAPDTGRACLVWMHGGAFAWGDLDMAASPCRVGRTPPAGPRTLPGLRRLRPLAGGAVELRWHAPRRPGRSDYALTLNPRTPAEAVSRFAAHPSIHVRWRLAVRTDLPQESYRTLAQDPIPGVRGDVAANPAIDEGLIRAIAHDTTYDVRRRLAHNPAIPLDVLAEVATTAKIGPVLLPRMASATPAEITALAASHIPAVRMLLAERHNLPRHIIDQLACDRALPGSAEAIPLPDASVDAMLAGNALH